jgi:hypothetical protein
MIDLSFTDLELIGHLTVAMQASWLCGYLLWRLARG